MSLVCLPPPKALERSQTIPSFSADYDFEYQDTEELQTTLEDFYNYEDLCLVSLPLLKERLSGLNSINQKTLEEALSSTDGKSREISLSVLLFWSLGYAGNNEQISPEIHVTRMTSANQTLCSINGLGSIYNTTLETFLDLEDWMSSNDYTHYHKSYSLLQSSQVQDSNFPDNVRKRPAVQNALMATSLLFNLIVCNASNDEFCHTVAQLKPPLDCFLFGLLNRATDPLWKKVFLKKILLLLWKSLLVIHGGLEKLEKLKNETRKALGLSPNEPAPSYPKSSPEDYAFYFEDMKKRYPNYVLPVPEMNLPSPPTFLRRQIAEYPTKLHPFVAQADGHLLPVPIREALEIYNKGMYKSHGLVQRQGKGFSRKDGSPAIDRIKILYSYLLPNLSTHMSTLLRHMYAQGVSPHVSPTIDLEMEVPFTKLPQEQKAKLLEVGDQTRTVTIYRKSISAILLLLLKAVKAHHVLEFEHICQILAETNFPLIFLKLLVSWFPSNIVRNSAGDRKVKAQSETLPSGDAWLRHKEEPIELNFFHFCHQRDIFQDPWINPGPQSPLSNRSSVSTKPEEDPRPSSFSAFFTTINLLRILQKVTKNKYCRLLHLIQLKTCNILQRILKIRHPTLEYYTLKLLKSQIPFLGKKWKSSHMFIVSQIYMTLKPRLIEEYMAADLEIQPAEAAKEEKDLKNRIKEYHDKVYSDLMTQSSTLYRTQKSSDDLELALTLTQQGMYDPSNEAHAQLLSSRIPFFVKGHHQLNETESSGEQPLMDEDVPPFFRVHYKDWLESEVFQDPQDEAVQELLQELEQEDDKSESDIQWSHSREERIGEKKYSFENVESSRGWSVSFDDSSGWDESFPSD